MPLHTLVRHPDSRCAAIERIEVELEREAHGMRLCYRLIGDAERVVAKPSVAAERGRRRDALWRSTCCELFVRDEAGGGYREYNFAPCGDWAAYRFSGYRAGMAPLETRAPRIALARSADAVALTVTLADVPLEGRFGLACVVETDEGIAYWALAHPPGKPDFHHASTFASTAAPGRAQPGA